MFVPLALAHIATSAASILPTAPRSSSKNTLTSKLKCETGINRLDVMVAKPGLRERKKQRTRELIAETAKRLFSERGFDAVTVTDVANAAEVSSGTVFNYFPTKEDVFYSEMQSFEEKLRESRC
jgi:hypothetical protein